MSVSTPAAPGSNGPWRILILDRDPQDPKWILATVAIAADVRPALLDAAGRFTGWQAAADWVAGLVGRPVALEPVHDALAWRVDEGGQR
jgi:hypothetical protein